MSDISILHNPACGTSRNVLAAIRASGSEPRVIEYLEHPPGRESLKALIARMGMTVRDVLRLCTTSASTSPYSARETANVCVVPAGPAGGRGRAEPLVERRALER